MYLILRDNKLLLLLQEVLPLFPYPILISWYLAEVLSRYLATYQCFGPPKSLTVTVTGCFLNSVGKDASSALGYQANSPLPSCPSDPPEMQSRCAKRESCSDSQMLVQIDSCNRSRHP